MSDVPTEEDWQSEPWDDLETPYAYRQFVGKSLDEAVALFAANAISRQEDLCWMPTVCFRHYIRAYITYLLSDDAKSNADAASCFFGLVRTRRFDIRDSDEGLVDMVEVTLRHLEKNQTWYDADQDIYGDFRERATTSLKLIGR